MKGIIRVVANPHEKNSCVVAHPGSVVTLMKHGSLRGMRIVFINMPLRESAAPNTPPQGPGLMAARLREYGADPSIVDLNAYRIKDDDAMRRNLQNGRHLTEREAQTLIESHFNKHGEPHVIGLSGKITTLKWQSRIAAMCRRLVPEAFIISGGGLSTEIKKGLFDWIPDLDAIGHSEGDDIMLLIAKDVKAALGSQNPSTLHAKNPYHIGEIAGRHRFVYAGDRPTDLDILPFAAWDLLEEDVFGNPVLEWYIKTPVWGTAANNSSATPFTMKRSLTTVSSRGCPFDCAFCYRGAQGERNYGLRSVENLTAEVKWLQDRYGVDFVGFPDDNFAVRIDRCQALPRAFEGLNFRWGTHTRLDEADMKRLPPMREAGCVYIGFGAESASEKTLIRLKKGGHILKRGFVRVNGFVFPRTMVEGIQNCREIGIHSNCTWIMGYPGETLDDLKVSVAFIMWQQELYTGGLTQGTEAYGVALASVNKRMFTATAYPGTAMFRDPDVKGLLTKHFGITFGTDGEPVCDEALKWYIEELDDATKVLVGKNGEPLNYGAMPLDRFLEARLYVDSGQIEKILDM